MTMHYLDIRKALVAGGLRSVAYAFDGAGDSGSLEGMLVPTVFPTPALADFAGDPLEDCYLPSKSYGKLPNGEYGYAENPSAKPVLALIKSVNTTPGAENALEDMAYAALEHFDGDWCNNDGGYGIVAIDLLTGEFRIDGFQRYTDTTDADSAGTIVSALDDDVEPKPLDLAALLKSTLNQA